MKRKLAVVYSALLSLGLSGAASATPFWFDFTGTISGGVNDVGPISGGFTFDTDRLYEPTLPVSSQRQWIDWMPTNLGEPLAFLDFGGESRTFPAGAGTNYGLISFVDACDINGCQPNSLENFSLFFSATDQVMSPDFTGTARTTTFYFSSAALTTLPDFPYIHTFDYFDLAQVDPTSIVSLPLHTMFGSYSETTFNCVLGACETADFRSFGVTVDDVTRGIGPREVPEPGTLVLMVAGLGGIFLIRRRTTRTNKSLVRCLAAALIAFGFAGTSQADPVYFNFTGTNIGGSLPGLPDAAIGQSVTGSFIFETDRLFRTESPGQVSFIDWQPTNPALPLATVSYGGRDVLFPVYDSSNYNFFTFNVPCASDPCAPAQPDGMNMGAESSTRPAEGIPVDFTGTYRSSFLFLFGSVSWTDPSIDSSNVGANDLLDLVLSNAFGVYSESVTTCNAGDCAFDSRSFSFSIDSYAAVTPVPEPGSLGMMGIGIAALLFLRRRRVA
jgi:hypothetical protein